MEHKGSKIDAPYLVEHAACPARRTSHVHVFSSRLPAQLCASSMHLDFIAAPIANKLASDGNKHCDGLPRAVRWDKINRYTVSGVPRDVMLWVFLASSTRKDNPWPKIL